ncbi:MAG: hypothetical protein QOE70_989 [Chthoniobacter sp.]|nr:hypothetical protein [Chthoniobacter sp.]
MTGDLFEGIEVEFDLTDVVQRTAFYLGERFEAPTASVLADWTKGENAVFFDIGANFGFYTFAVWSRCRDATIFSFEPNPKTFRKLSEIVEKNGLDRITPCAIALAHEQSLAALHFDSVNSGAASLGGGIESQSESVMVSVITFCDFLERNSLEIPSTPRWVAKIDVEGFELKVLRGMEPALRRKAFRGLCIEFNEENLARCGNSTREIEAFLGNVGYSRLNETSLETRAGHMDNVFFVPTADPAPMAPESSRAQRQERPRPGAQ